MFNAMEFKRDSVLYLARKARVAIPKIIQKVKKQIRPNQRHNSTKIVRKLNLSREWL